MITKIALFELSNGFRRISTYIYFALFFGFGFLIFMAAAGAFPGVNMGLGAGGKLYANSSFMLFALISSTSYYGLLVVAAVMGNAAQRDFRHNTFPLVFTSPVSKMQYLSGRFCAANVILLFVFSSIGIGCFVASMTPKVDQSLIGPQHLMAYLYPYLIAVIPNTLILGAVFFGLAALTRSMLPVYVSAVVLFVGYLIAAVLSTQLESKFVAGIIDPFGNYALEHVTRYWTVDEKNSQTIPLTGLMLVNRAIWMVLGLAALGLTSWLFRMEQGGEDRGPMRASPSGGGGAGRNVALPVTPVQPGIVLASTDLDRVPSDRGQHSVCADCDLRDWIRFRRVALHAVALWHIRLPGHGRCFGTRTRQLHAFHADHHHRLFGAIGLA